MARVTVEDCLKVVPNRFELVLLASHRTKQIINGSPIKYEEKKKEKNTVISLREISENLLDINELKDNFSNDIQNILEFKSSNEESILDDDNNSLDIKNDTDSDDSNIEEDTEDFEDTEEIEEDEDSLKE